VSATSHSLRWIELDGAVNARAVVPRVLLRADNLQSLSARDVRRLVDEHALEVVIDLRTDVEVKHEGDGPMSAERGVRIELRSLYPDSTGDVDLAVAAATKPWEAIYGEQSLEETPVVRAYLGYLRRRRVACGQRPRRRRPAAPAPAAGARRGGLKRSRSRSGSGGLSICRVAGGTLARLLVVWSGRLTRPWRGCCLSRMRYGQ
jgi:hypothetical protein